MKAMLLDVPGRPLRAADVPDPAPGPGQVLLARLGLRGLPHRPARRRRRAAPTPKLPLVPGHEIVGVVEAVGARRVAARAGRPRRRAVARLRPAARAATARRAARTSATRPRFTGYTWTAASPSTPWRTSASASRSRTATTTSQAAPLLCAGLIGYRTRCGWPATARALGLYGFGAAAHIVAQVARVQGREVFAFTRPGDAAAQEFARSLGAVWAGGSDELAARAARRRASSSPRSARWCRPRSAAVRKGGIVVCGGIHMSDIPSFPYELLWGERVLRSVANLTRRDGRGVPRPRGEGRREEPGAALSARTGERGPRGPAGRAARGRGGPRAVSGLPFGFLEPAATPAREPCEAGVAEHGVLEVHALRPEGAVHRAVVHGAVDEAGGVAELVGDLHAEAVLEDRLGELVLLRGLQAGEGEDASAPARCERPKT